MRKRLASLSGHLSEPLGHGLDWFPRWQLRQAATDAQWYGVAWSPGLSLFAAVGYGPGSTFGGTSDAARAMTSPDGITWTRRASATGDGWTSVCWSPSLALFCAVRESGANRVMTSADGVTWTQVVSAPAAAGTWWSVCWADFLGLFVAVGEGAGVQRVMTSPDGAVWTLRNATAALSWTSVASSGALLVACSSTGYTGASTAVMTSIDGINWSAATIGSAVWHSVAWAPFASRWVAGAYSDHPTAHMAYSADGATWATTAPQAQGTGLGDKSIVVADNARVVLRVTDAGPPQRLDAGVSWDGTQWSFFPTPSKSHFFAQAAYAPELRRAVAVAWAVQGQAQPLDLVMTLDV